MKNLKGTEGLKKVIVLPGPTGVGKTAVSILLAEYLKTEIISSDSMQIYRYMDIGTAKPSETLRAGVVHHMLDIANPWETYSVGQYIKDVVPIIDRLHNLGKIPIIIGGTGLYIKAMTRGIFGGPAADWKLRLELIAEEKESPGSLMARLKELDPVAAARIMSNDIRRVVRALEVCTVTMKAMSELHETATAPLPYDFIKIGLMRARGELYPMIERRVDVMLANGLTDEVKLVLKMIEEYGTSAEYSSLQAIGYKEIAAALAAQISFDEAVHLIKKRSKMYAKRQTTWFKKEEGIIWTDLTGVVDEEAMFQKALAGLEPFIKGSL